MSCLVGEAVFDLYRVFKLLNEHFYKNELDTPVINIAFKEDKAVNVATKKIEHDEHYFYEMTVAIKPEKMNSPVTLETIGELMHEMCHLYNKQHNINDTTNNNRYHNKKFKNVAITHGLSMKNEKHDSLKGWGETQLNEEAKQFLSSIGFGEPMEKIADQPSIRTIIKNDKTFTSIEGEKKNVKS